MKKHIDHRHGATKAETNHANKNGIEQRKQKRNITAKIKAETQKEDNTQKRRLETQAESKTRERITKPSTKLGLALFDLGRCQDQARSILQKRFTPTALVQRAAHPPLPSLRAATTTNKIEKSQLSVSSGSGCWPLGGNV